MYLSATCCSDRFGVRASHRGVTCRFICLIKSAISSLVRGILTAIENMTDQPFEFLLPITKIANEVIVLVHRQPYFQLWRMVRKQEAYNIIL